MTVRGAHLASRRLKVRIESWVSGLGCGIWVLGLWISASHLGPLGHISMGLRGFACRCLAPLKGSLWRGLTIVAIGCSLEEKSEGTKACYSMIVCGVHPNP